MTSRPHNFRYHWQTLWFAGLLLCAQLLVTLHALDPAHDGMADNCEICLVGHQLTNVHFPDPLIVPLVPTRVATDQPVIPFLALTGTTTPCQRGPPGHLHTA